MAEQVKHTHAKAGGGVSTHTHAGAISGHRHSEGDPLNVSDVALLPLPKGALSGKSKDAYSEDGAYVPAPYHKDPDETLQCSVCGKYDDTDAAYCDQCGAPLTHRQSQYTVDADETIKCPNCTRYNDTDARFCDQCGLMLAGRTDVGGAVAPA